MISVTTVLVWGTMVTERYTTLIDAALVASRVDDEAWVVLDTRFDLRDPQAGRRAYDEGHVPGAQYVHLEHEGSLVAVGDTVKRGQPIGMVGLTGFTSTEHLHFNVLIPDSTEGMVSIPITFSDETPGASLTRGSRVSH